MFHEDSILCFGDWLLTGKSAQIRSTFLPGDDPGRLQNRNWEDEQGQKHYVTEVVAEELDFVETKKNREPDMNILNGTAPVELPNTKEGTEDIISGDDLPF